MGVFRFVLCKWLFARFFLKREALLLIAYQAPLLSGVEQALIIVELRGHSWYRRGRCNI